MNPPTTAGGEETGAAGGGGGCRGAEGGGEAAGTAGVPGEPGLSASEESLEEKLRTLTFRKQVSYRWVPGGWGRLRAPSLPFLGTSAENGAPANGKVTGRVRRRCDW